jgi:acyl-CoA reductase-like NAD-dependent aldehyde dehydrogenase
MFEENDIEIIAVLTQERLLRLLQSNPATVVDRVRPDCRLVADETFGPAAPVIRFESVEEAIAITNGTRYGLSAAVCTQRWDVMQRFIHALDVGTVNVWEVPGYRTEASPFGGIKSSGLGYKEGVREAMRSFTRLKTFSLPWSG